MADARVTLEAIRGAAGLLGPYLHRTPLVRSAHLSERLGVELFLKLENQQKTGSFKPRGAFVTMLGLDPAVAARGVITISAGNHAQAVAYAAQKLGLAATVVMPASASPIKAAAACGYGAEVILHGDVHAAFVRLEELRQERGLAFVHPFDSVDAVRGQGTVGLEIMEDLPGADLVVVGVGGGGLAAGVALAATELRPGVRVVGVEPTGAPAMTRSRGASVSVRLETTDTIADGLAPPFVGALPLAICNQRLADVVLVEDAEIVAAMVVLFERLKTVAEPAGAAALGALLAGKIPLSRGERVVAIVSGGNLAAATFAQLLA